MINHLQSFANSKNSLCDSQASPSEEIRKLRLSPLWRCISGRLRDAPTIFAPGGLKCWPQPPTQARRSYPKDAEASARFSSGAQEDESSSLSVVGRILLAFGLMRLAFRLLQRFGSALGLGFSRCDRRRLPVCKSRFANSKMIRDLYRIARVEPGWADNASVRDCMPDTQALLVPGASLPPVREPVDRLL